MTPIVKSLSQSNNGWYLTSDYFGIYDGICHRKDFCHYLLDTNNTIQPLSWYEFVSQEQGNIENVRYDNKCFPYPRYKYFLCAANSTFKKRQIWYIQTGVA